MSAALAPAPRRVVSASVVISKSTPRALTSRTSPVAFGPTAPSDLSSSFREMGDLTSALAARGGDCLDDRAGLRPCARAAQTAGSMRRIKQTADALHATVAFGRCVVFMVSLSVAAPRARNLPARGLAADERQEFGGARGV